MDSNTLILLLESSTKVCSVALALNGKVIAQEETPDGNKHSEWMTVYVERVFQAVGYKYNQLNAIVVSQGPGSYTGLRVAYSVAKGMAFRLSIPIIEVDTLSSLAHGYQMEHPLKDDEVIIPMIDARRMEVYLQALDSDMNIIKTLEAHIFTEQSFDGYLQYNKIHLVGDGAPKVNELDLDEDVQRRICIHNVVCSASHLLHEAMIKFDHGAFSDIAYCTPNYLKSPNITTSKKSVLGTKI